MGRIDCGVKRNNINDNNIGIFKHLQDNKRPVSPKISRRF